MNPLNWRDIGAHTDLFFILVLLLVGLGIGIPCLLGDMRVLHLYVLEGGIVLILVYLVFSMANW